MLRLLYTDAKRSPDLMHKAKLLNRHQACLLLNNYDTVSVCIHDGMSTQNRRTHCQAAPINSNESFWKHIFHPLFGHLQYAHAACSKDYSTFEPLYSSSWVVAQRASCSVNFAGAAQQVYDALHSQAHRSLADAD